MTAPHTPDRSQFGGPSYPPPPSGAGRHPVAHDGPDLSSGPPTGRQPAGYPPPPPAPAPPERPVAATAEPTVGAHAHQRPQENLGQPLANVGQLVANITEDLSTLVRQETDLAKAEIRQSAARAGKGAGLFGGAGVAGHMALLFLSIAAWWGIAHLIESFGWAAVIVGVLWAIAAAAMAAMGRKEINSIKGLERTAETASKIPDALKGNETTNG